MGGSSYREGFRGFPWDPFLFLLRGKESPFPGEAETGSRGELGAPMGCNPDLGLRVNLQSGVQITCFLHSLKTGRRLGPPV